MKLALIFPMYEEAEEFLKETEARVLEDGPFPHYAVTGNDYVIDIYLCGVGKAMAAACAAHAIIKVDPDEVILAGSCCGLGTMPVLASFVPSTTKQIDFQFDKPIKAKEEHKLRLAAELANSILGMVDPSPATVFTTGDSFLEDLATKKSIATTHFSKVYDMESAAVAQICQFYGKEFYALRVVSDNFDGDMQAFERNLPNVSMRIAAVLLSYLSLNQG